LRIKPVVGDVVVASVAVQKQSAGSQPSAGPPPR
jgi:hypothetical protein